MTTPSELAAPVGPETVDLTLAMPEVVKALDRCTAELHDLTMEAGALLLWLTILIGLHVSHLIPRKRGG